MVSGEAGGETVSQAQQRLAKTASGPARRSMATSMSALSARRNVRRTFRAIRNPLRAALDIPNRYTALSRYPDGSEPCRPGYADRHLRIACIAHGTGNANTTRQGAHMKRWMVVAVGITVAGCTSAAYRPSHSAGERQAYGDGRHDDHEDREDDLTSSDPTVLARARSVVVVPQNDAGCESEALGLVDVHRGTRTQEQALNVLRQKAARLGADKVIGVEFHHGEAEEDTSHLSGVAVRCRAFLQGRRYDVLGTIEVQGNMGREERAMAELKSRAYTLHADLVIGVQFEHGDGEGKPSRLTGTAIRFVHD